MVSPDAIRGSRARYMATHGGRVGTVTLIAAAPVLLPFAFPSSFDLSQFQLILILCSRSRFSQLEFYRRASGPWAERHLRSGCVRRAFSRTPPDGRLVWWFCSRQRSPLRWERSLEFQVSGARKWYMAMLSFFMIVVAQDLIGQLQSLTNGAEGDSGVARAHTFWMDHLKSPDLVFHLRGDPWFDAAHQQTTLLFQLGTGTAT